jgi:starch phosphorylase
VKDRANPSVFLAGGTLLDPSVLTLDFARRFATYKRADLIFYDRNRLNKLLNDRWRPIQIIYAGKVHPTDDHGKRILQRVFNASRDPEMGRCIAAAKFSARRMVKEYVDKFYALALQEVSKT